MARRIRKASWMTLMNAPTKTPSAEAILLREDLPRGLGKIAMLTLNRPAARNSLSEALLTRLSESFAAIAKDRDIRAVVICGQRPGLLRRPRSEGIDRAPHRCRWRHAPISSTS